MRAVDSHMMKGDYSCVMSVISVTIPTVSIHPWTMYQKEHGNANGRLTT